MTDNAIMMRPIRAGVYLDLQHAKNAVNGLLAARFSVDQITVVCSDEILEAHFREFEHEHPAGANTPWAASLGSALGAAFGGLSVSVITASAVGLPMALPGGAAGACTGGLLGGFIGAMMTRGTEKELANFYDQSVIDGRILVAVEVHGENAESRLAEAESILHNSGAQPLPLPEG